MEPEIEDLPYPGHPNRGKRSKHEDIFYEMVPGQCIKVPPDEAINYSKALTRWIKRNGKSEHFYVRYITKNPDGMARVWLLRKSVKMSDVPSRKIIGG